MSVESVYKDFCLTVNRLNPQLIQAVVASRNPVERYRVPISWLDNRFPRISSLPQFVVAYSSGQFRIDMQSQQR